MRCSRGTPRTKQKMAASQSAVEFTIPEERWPSVILFSVLTLSMLISALILKWRRRGQLFLSGRVLFVTAHPDDECMFFGPTILSAARLNRDAPPYLLCLSTGDFYGKGEKRISELLHSCCVLGIPATNVTAVCDNHLPDAPNVWWDPQHINKHISEVVRHHNINTVVTFDLDGVSGHANHRATHAAIASLFESGSLQGVTTVFVLSSVCLARKYSGPFDLLCSLLFSRFVLVSGLTGYFCILRAMLKHRTQMVWFRWLYLIFSRYMTVNTLQELH